MNHDAEIAKYRWEIDTLRADMGKLQERADLYAAIVNEKDLVILRQKKRLEYFENLRVVKIHVYLCDRCKQVRKGLAKTEKSVKLLLKSRCFSVYVFMRKIKGLLTGHGFNVVGRV